MYDYYIGIDPGKAGGIAIVPRLELAKLNHLPEAWEMPDTERDIYDLINEQFGKSPILIDFDYFALIEDVHTFPKDAAKAAFTFGKGYGGLRMALIATDVPFIEVRAATWQRHFRLPTIRQCGGKSGTSKSARASRARAKTVKKNAHKAKAQQLFPHLKITHAIADALLIAQYNCNNDRNQQAK